MSAKRASKIPVSNYFARNAQQIFEGKLIVPELEDTEDRIGRITEYCCPFCKAKSGTSSAGSATLVDTS